MIHHCCPVCRQWQHSAEDQIGRSVVCHGCGNSMEVPAASDSAFATAAHAMSATAVDEVTNGLGEGDRILRRLAKRRFWPTFLGFVILLVVLVGITVPLAW